MILPKSIAERRLTVPLLDTNTKTDQISEAFVSELFMQTVSFASFAAHLERAYVKRRQAEGIANARSQGKHMGRPRIPKPMNFNELYDLWRAGGITALEAMYRMKLKRSTFERFVKERKEELRIASEPKNDSEQLTAS